MPFHRGSTSSLGDFGAAAPASAMPYMKLNAIVPDGDPCAVGVLEVVIDLGEPGGLVGQQAGPPSSSGKFCNVCRCTTSATRVPVASWLWILALVELAVVHDHGQVDVGELLLEGRHDPGLLRGDVTAGVDDKLPPSARAAW